MKILVTGATGFIGNYVIPLLVERGHQVIATSVHPGHAVSRDWYKSVTYIPFDLSTVEAKRDYFQFFDRPDKMIHLAWEGLPNYPAPFHETVNLPRHQYFLSGLIRNGLSDITVTGTCLEYGMQEGALTENLPAQPIIAYARAKNQLRIFLEAMQAEFPVQLKWVRLFYVYGKGQNPNSLLSQLDRALENGEKNFNMSGGQQVRDFLPVETAVRYIVGIAEQGEQQGIFNGCSGDPITVEAFVRAYLLKKNASIHLNLGHYPYPNYEPMRFWGDAAKLMTIIKES